MQMPSETLSRLIAPEIGCKLDAFDHHAIQSGNMRLARIAVGAWVDDWQKKALKLTAIVIKECICSAHNSFRAGSLLFNIQLN